MPAPQEPVLTADEHELLMRATHEFNRGAYFECHDKLEDLWSGLRGPARDFFQGLIQIAVGLYHLGNGNLAGAESMFTRALRRLDPYPAVYYGFDLGRWRAALELQRAWLHSGAPVPAPAPLPATWCFAATPYTDLPSTEQS